MLLKLLWWWKENVGRGDGQRPLKYPKRQTLNQRTRDGPSCVILGRARVFCDVLPVVKGKVKRRGGWVTFWAAVLAEGSDVECRN